MKRLFFICALALLAQLNVFGQSGAEIRQEYWQSLATHQPYPVPAVNDTIPEGYAALMLNHVSRHGARYPSSSQNVIFLIETLQDQKLTAQGRNALAIALEVKSLSEGCWGALDSVGYSEQEGIARRAYFRTPSLFESGSKVDAISSYVPRCTQSMYAFMHQLNTLDDQADYSTAAGPENNALMRPFQIDSAFIAYRKKGPWLQVYAKYREAHLPVAPALRLFAARNMMPTAHAQNISEALYSVVSMLPAMGLPNELQQFFSLEEAEAMAEVSMKKHELEWTATQVSALPAKLAGPLLADIITTLDDAAMDPATYKGPTAILRFGHAETMLPLLSLLGLPTSQMPMACNLQLLLLQSQEGHLLLKALLNERPVIFPYVQADDNGIMPWRQARNYLLSRLPL